MHIRSPKDFWAGLIFVAIGGGFILLAQQYRHGDMHRMGPAMFPTLVGALLAALGAVIALRSFVLAGEPVPRFHAAADRRLAARHRAVRHRAAMARPRRRGRRAGAGRRAMPPATCGRWRTLALAVVMVLFSVAVFVWLLGLPLPLWPDS